MSQSAIVLCVLPVLLAQFTAAQYTELFQHACMDQTDPISLSCSSPDVIYILNAEYGQYTDLGDTCPKPEQDDCLVDSYKVNNNTMLDLQTECDEKSSCSYRISSENLLTWCGFDGMDFFLITYTCYEAGGLPTTLPPTEPTTKVTPPTRIPSTTEKDDNSGGDNTAAIVGGVIGGLIVIVFFGIVIFLVVRNNKAANARARANPLKRKKPKNQQNGAKPTDSEVEKAFTNIASDPNGYDNQACIYGFTESEAQPLTKAKRMSMAAAANSAAEKAIAAELDKPLSGIEEVDGKKVANGHVKDETNEDKLSDVKDTTEDAKDNKTAATESGENKDDSNVYEAVEMKEVDKESNDS